jgi:hypothetical protein
VLTGEPPRLEDTAAVRERLTAIARDLQFPDPSALSHHVAQLLETHPDDRPVDLNHWADELDALIAPARSTRRGSSGASRQRERGRIGAFVAGVLVAALAGGAVALTASSGSGNPEGSASSSTTAALAAATSTTNAHGTATTLGPDAVQVRILNARTNEPFPEWANDAGALLRACPKVGCVDDGSNRNDMYSNAFANGDVVMHGLDPSTEYTFKAMAIDVDGCPPYYQGAATGDKKFWFAPDVSGTPSEVDGTTFQVVDNC